MDIFILIPFIVLFAIGLSLVFHGWLVVNQFLGYQHNPSVNIHPEMKNVKRGEMLLVMNITDNDYENLQKKIQELKMRELFEEPSSYEDEEDPDNDFLV